MKVMAGVLALAALGVIVWLAVRHGRHGASVAPAARTPVAGPRVELTAAEERTWAPLQADRSAIRDCALPRDRPGERLLRRAVRATKAWIAFVAAGDLRGIVIWLMPNDDSQQTAQPRSSRPRHPPRCPHPTSREREKERWARLPPDRSAIPALLYHGVGPESNFESPEDAAEGIATEDFARQLTLMKQRRLPDRRSPDLRRLRPRQGGRSPPAAGADHFRRRACRLLDERRPHHERAGLQRCCDGRCRHRRPRR